MERARQPLARAIDAKKEKESASSKKDAIFGKRLRSRAKAAGIESRRIS